MRRSALALCLLLFAGGCAESSTPGDGDPGDGGRATDAGRAWDSGSGRVDTGVVFPDAGGGPCTSGSVIPCETSCGSAGRQLCTAGMLEPCIAPTEDCNGADDDCDTMVDESVTRACATMCGTAGIERCEGGAWSTCTAEVTGAETCNGMDDDCDGSVDEDTGVYVEASSYVVLSSAHPGCDGAAERYGPTCNAAIHRHCAATACASSGFGPVENSADTATITCVAGAGRSTSYTVLSTHHGSCTAAGERMGPNCNAAIHRYCASEGFVSGFGPVENSGDTAAVTCVPAAIAEVRTTSYTTLAGSHAPCNGTAERIGPNCNAAIHRWCRSQGFDSGFGPVENSGDTAIVTCVR